MKNKLLFIALLISVSVGMEAQGAWTCTVTNAYAIGCPGYISVNGPVSGYTFQVNPPPIIGPVIPGGYGDVDFGVWAGIYSVTVTQNSTGNIVQTFTNVSVGQPITCGLDLINPSVTYGCYNGNEISFTVSGNFCAGGTIQVMKNNAFFSQIYFNGPGIQYIDNLTPGSYFLSATDSFCSDTMTININNNCEAPVSGFAATNIFKTSARVNWTTKPCAVAYTVQYKKANTTTWTSKYVNSNTGNVKLTGLTAGTTYKWRVKSKCNLVPASLSVFSPVQTFTTAAPRQAIDLADVESQGTVTVYPNPATASVTIQSDFDFNDNVQLTLTDINGREVNLSFVRNSENQINADINNVSNGIYQLKITDGNNLYLKKLAVVK